ncbi:MAG: GNAT family N-acetyltransferase [Syntrophobacterales bacterium]|nr:GNAT family N-acetyltransferase [Syntrophobacterales bacterium]
MHILVRPLTEADLPLADRIFRLAFGTFNGLANPLEFGGDLDKIRTRWLADPAAAFGAEADGELVASNFVTHWGSVGYFGPLTVRPDYWDRGVAQKLLEPTLALFDTWGCRHTGLYTYSQSPKHLSLYQKFGFWPRALTAIMALTVRPATPAGEVTSYARAAESEKPDLIAAAAQLTDAIYAGLDVRREILAIQSQKLGDTLLLWDRPGLVGLAAVHCGPGSEAGSGACFIKFGAVKPGRKAEQYFDRLLTACQVLAATRGNHRLIAGVSLAREPAYKHLRARGFKPEIVGVTMHRPNEAAYHRPEAWVMDDWR